MKKRRTNSGFWLVSGLGLAILLMLFGSSTLLLAQQQSTLNIPIILQPEKGVYSFLLTGEQLNTLIGPLQNKERIKKDEWVKVSFQRRTVSHRISLDAVPGVVQSSDMTQSSQVFFMKEWEVRLADLSGLNSYIMSKEDIDLLKTVTNKRSENEMRYNLPSSKTFSVEIHTNRLRAELLLPPTSDPQVNNPVSLVQKRAPAGGPIEYIFRDDAVKADGKSKVSILFLSETTGETLKVASLDVGSKPNVQGLRGTALLPRAGRIGEKWIRSQPIKAVALVTHKDGGFTIKVEDVAVTRGGAGILLGFLVIVILLILILVVKAIPFSEQRDKDRYQKWRKLSRLEKFVRFPLHFTVTPLGRYSISLAQILFWTVVVIFAFVYVGFTRGEFLEITGQILTLLGISGTTAVAAKVTAMARVGEIPDEYMTKIVKNRLPRFRDLFSIGDVPSIFKSQIFTFTLLAGILVMRELLRTGNFPVLEDNLLVLMGISGGVYIANELATENIWKKVRELIADINRKRKEKVELETELHILNGELKQLQQEEKVLKTALEQRSQSASIPTDDPDKLREIEIKKRIAEIKGELEKEKRKNELKTELDGLEARVKSVLKDIYYERSGTEDTGSD